MAGGGARWGDGDGLGYRILAQLVIEADPEAVVNLVSWTRAAPARQRITARLEQLGGHRELGTALRELHRAPTSIPAFQVATTRLDAVLTADAAAAEPFLADLDEAERLGCARYQFTTVDDLTTVDEGAVPEPGRPATAAAPDPMTVIIPVRARPGEPRGRNLVAAVAAIADQDIPRRAYRIVVVEQDDRPWCAELLRPLADEYVFAYNPGAFNKSWALNIGARATDAGRLVLLDADSLVDRAFLGAVHERFGSGCDAFLPFTELLYLDQDSTTAAIERRRDPASHPPGRALRGFSLVDVRGFAVCVTRERFLRCGGYDERFRGWGDEDNEFHAALTRTGGVARDPGVLTHSWHPRPRMVVSGLTRPNHHLVGSPRPPEASAQHGRLDKYILQGGTH